MSILENEDRRLLNIHDIETLFSLFNETDDNLRSAFRIEESALIAEVFYALNDNTRFVGVGERSCYRIKRIGKYKDTEQTDKDIIRLRDTADSLVNTGNSIGIILSKKDGNQSVVVEGKNLSKESLLASLKAWNNYAEVEECSSVNNRLKYQRIANCLPFKGNPEQLNEQTINWISAVAAADIHGDYRVRVYVENADSNYIDSKISNLTRIHKKLSAIKEWNLNVTLGKSSTETENQKQSFREEVRRTGDKIHGEKKITGINSTDGDNASASISKSVNQSLVKELLELVEENLRNLLVGKTGGMKHIAFLCEAANAENINVLTGIVSTALSKKNYAVRWKSLSNNLESNIYSAEVPLKDISSFVCLPMQDFPGYERKQNDELAVNAVDSHGDLVCGKIIWNGTLTSRPLQLDSNKLNRHLSIFGMTGSGKSNTVFSILEQADVPFMVIEPVKSEYKIMREHYSDLTVHHMNPQQEGVLQINPFWFPQGCSLSFHMDAIKKIISSAFSLYAAMPNILEQCIYSCYVKKGWNVVKSINVFADIVPEEYLYPTFSDLCDEIELYLEKSDFEGESLSSYQGALLSRLKSFTTGLKGVLLNTTNHPNFSEWIGSRHVIELDGLSDDADKSVVMGALIMQYFQCVKSTMKSCNELKHIIVVEEAHRLFKNNTQTVSNQEVAAPEAQLVDTLSNMMAEIRAYGEGIIIVDQSPNKVSPDVVSNSSTKIIHRLDNKEDIERIESSLLMDSLSPIISSLSQGESLLRTDGMEKPIKILVSKSSVKDSAKEYIYKPAIDYELDSIANVDFVLNNDDFCKDFIDLSERFINNILFDNLENSKYFFYVMLKETEKLLHLHSYSELVANANRGFYLNLINCGIKKSLETSGMWNNLFSLQMLMFTKRLCNILSEGTIKRKEIDIFSEFRADVLHEQIEIKNRNSGVQAQGIAMICGFYSIYTDIVLRLSVLIEDSGIEFDNEQNLSIEAFVNLLEEYWKKLFIVPPDQAVRDSIVLIIRSIYKVISNNTKA